MRSLAVCFLVLLAACASAPNGPVQRAPAAASVSSPQAGNAAPVEADSGAYALDPRHASVIWRVRHQGLSWYVGRFNTLSAHLQFDAADPARSSLEAHIDARSLDTDLPGGAAQFNQTIARALGAETAPDISVRSTSIERTGANSGRIHANLTLNGQTHPIVLDAVFNGATQDILRGGKRVIGFSATTRIDRTQWGVEQWRMFTGADVEIAIEAEFVAE
jgi:polyisoprenoid-binding protein YceI